MKLGDICKIKYGKDHKKLNDGSIPVYGSGGVMRHVDAVLWNKPSVLIPRKGTLGNLFYVDEPFWTVDTLFWTDIDAAQVVPKYLFYQLKTKDLASLNVGTAVPSLTTEVLNEVQIDLPSLEKQKQIVEVLGCIDAKIVANAKLNGYLAELQQAIYVDSAKEGTLATIGEIAEVIDCLHSKKPQRQPSGKPLIQLNNIIDDGILDMTDTFCISEDDYAKWISRCEVKPGDCVITNVGRIGAVSQVPRGTTAAMGRNMTCIRPGTYAATVITALCSNAMRHEIEKRTDAGTIMNALNVRNIPKLEFYLPPAKIRDSVETTLKTIQDARELLLKERQELAALRDALLPKLMFGEIDVSKVDLTQLNSHLA